VKEKYGLVFVFLGDLPEEQRCPIMEIAEYRGEQPDPGWRATIQHFEWDIDYQRSIENGLDGAHNEFVHPTHGYSGNRDDIRIAVEDYEIVNTEWDSGHFSSRRAPPLADAKMREASGRTVDAIIRGGTGHHGAAQVWTLIHPTEKMSIHQYLFEAPIDEGRTSLYLVNLRNFLVDPAEDARMMGRNEAVAFQDRDVLQDLQPVMTPHTRTKEFFTPSRRAASPATGNCEPGEDWRRIGYGRGSTNHRRAWPEPSEPWPLGTGEAGCWLACRCGAGAGWRRGNLARSGLTGFFARENFQAAGSHETSTSPGPGPCRVPRLPITGVCPRTPARA
jgi:hypothetical protein